MQVILTKWVVLLAVVGAARADTGRLPSVHPDQVGNAIESLVRAALETLRADMPRGFPQLGVPPLDPWDIGDIPLNITSDVLTLFGNVSQLVISQLSTFNIDKVKANMLSLKVDVALSLPSLTVSGDYAVDGLVAMLFPAYGGGPLKVNLSDVPLEVVVDLNLNGTHYQVETLDFSFSIGALDVQLHGLFDSEPMADVVDQFVDDFGPLLVDILVNDTRRDLIPIIIEIINSLLSAPLQRLTLSEEGDEPLLENEDESLPENVDERLLDELALKPLQSTASANEYFDRMLENMRLLLLDSGLDPIALPDVTLELLGTGVKLHGGHLDGLGNVHRTGDAVIYYEDDWLGISGHIGFNGLGGTYSCKIEVLHIGPDVTATATITETSVFFAAKISSSTLEMQLVNFDIENVGDITVDISGLGIFDWLLAPLSEAITNLLKGVVTDIINAIVKPVLATFLSTINLMYILEHII